MTRLSGDDKVQVHGRDIVRNGFDYDLQVWVINFIIQDSNSARAQGLTGTKKSRIKRGSCKFCAS
jgi:hypothetical protein